MRTGARWFKLRRIPLQMEDILIYGALVSFAITTALYLATVPTFFNVEAIEQGRMEPYAGLQDDLVLMLHEFFVVQFFFWLTLWMVKWSLMCMFKKLTDGLPLYNRIWWGVLVFSILTFIGCCISNFTSCSSMHAWFTAGECSTPRDARAKEISLWFSLAVDLATDLLSNPTIAFFNWSWLTLGYSYGGSYARPLGFANVAGGKAERRRCLCRWTDNHGYGYHTKRHFGVKLNFWSSQYDVAHHGKCRCAFYCSISACSGFQLSFLPFSFLSWATHTQTELTSIM